jgi:hypothetical protein
MRTVKLVKTLNLRSVIYVNDCSVLVPIAHHRLGEMSCKLSLIQRRTALMLNSTYGCAMTRFPQRGGGVKENVVLWLPFKRTARSKAMFIWI